MLKRSVQPLHGAPPYETRAVTWDFGATFVGIDPLEANLVASRSCPCFRFGSVVIHLPVPSILYSLFDGQF